MRMRCEHIKQTEFEEMVIEEQFEREGILSNILHMEAWKSKK